ncbi:FAD-dependent monooxygenase [Streptomyces sp. NPDC055134]
MGVQAQEEATWGVTSIRPLRRPGRPRTARAVFHVAVHRPSHPSPTSSRPETKPAPQSRQVGAQGLVPDFGVRRRIRSLRYHRAGPGPLTPPRPRTGCAGPADRPATRAASRIAFNKSSNSRASKTARELAHYGVPVTVLETNLATVDQPKAGTLHARTVQQLSRRGYVTTHTAHPDQLARPVADHFHFAGMSGLTISAPGTEAGPIIGRSQADLERHFEACARGRGVTVLRGHRVTDVRQGPDSVEVVVEGPGGVREFTARYLVGASALRRVLSR